MTYFGFLVLFLFLPIITLSLVAILDQRSSKKRPSRLSYWPYWAATTLHALIALTYTTPWDNYLVANEVWWYDPDLVTGITFGWVPIEEYTFFLVQPILAALWILFLIRRIKPVQSPGALKNGLRFWLLIPLVIFWIGTVVIFITDWEPGTYLALELFWAIPPIGLQILFGADILWRYRKPVLLAITSLTLFLSAADALAINLEIWTISPLKSLDWYIFGLLPLEELLFFLVTNTLITFGIVLVIAEESHSRFSDIRHWLQRQRSSTKANG